MCSSTFIYCVVHERHIVEEKVLTAGDVFHNSWRDCEAAVERWQPRSRGRCWSSLVKKKEREKLGRGWGFGPSGEKGGVARKEKQER